MKNDDYFDHEAQTRALIAAMKNENTLRGHLYNCAVPESEVDDLISLLKVHLYFKFTVEQMGMFPLILFKLRQILHDWRKSNRREKRTMLIYTPIVPDLPVPRHFATEPQTWIEERAFMEGFFSDYPSPFLDDIEKELLYFCGRGFGTENVARWLGLSATEAKAIWRRARSQFRNVHRDRQELPGGKKRPAKRIRRRALISA